MYTLRLIPAKEIDAAQWNRLVASAENGLIYSRTDYLHAVCANWTGLVVNEYEAVMPLPYKSKLGFTYWYTPPFVQQLGLSGHPELCRQPGLLQEIMERIGQERMYGSVLLNHSNNAVSAWEGITRKPNYVLNLNRPYPEISGQYAQDLKQNIKKAVRSGIEYSNQVPIQTAIDLFVQHHAHQSKHIHSSAYDAFSLLCNQVLSAEEQCFTRAALNSSGQIAAVALMLKDGKRIYNLMNTTTAAGRQQEANHYLMDQLIQEFSEEALLLDFEGSSLPGVQKFYQKFGAAEETYYLFRYNRLPFPLSLLK
ncbi:MAG: GNAT family N-acetyltransferase [Sediminibacterium sp.]|nr:GNAT family N-acetyltransferase [Sediminibacterium sp.]